MSRRTIPLAVAIVLVLGCGKKKDEPVGGPDSGTPSPAAGSQPGSAVTIKIRDEQKGDKFTVTETRTSTMLVNAPKGKLVKSNKGTERTEYTETVLEMPAGGTRATKATRAYKTSETSVDGGAPKAASYSGKTVLIEKSGEKYAYTVDGAPLSAAEAAKFQQSFEKTDKVRTDDLLPKKPVSVNESWTLTDATLKKVSGDMGLPVVAEKSKATGKLLKTYTKDGKPWGTIEIKVDLVIQGAKDGIAMSGTVGATMTLDTVIDNSSLDAAMKSKAKIQVTAKQPNGVEVETIIDIDSEETRTTVK